jgi:uncharacterized protein (DUF2147 family)
MKNTLALSFMLFTAMSAFSQKINPDDVVGIWAAGENKARIQIYRSGNKYYGKIIWLKEPLKDGKPKLDHKNPDAKLRSMPVIGLIVLKDFMFEDDEWHSGEIYDPSSGKKYSCRITMPNKNTLKVRGFIGFSLFGRTETWKRA